MGYRDDFMNGIEIIYIKTSRSHYIENTYAKSRIKSLIAQSIIHECPEYIFFNHRFVEILASISIANFKSIRFIRLIGQVIIALINTAHCY